ncbi:hypothetical protein HDU83_001958 [Entophlyctis luteolus]|nr:hypothetical protein HDU83_001958 [Entophlyctis luteolus]
MATDLRAVAGGGSGPSGGFHGQPLRQQQQQQQQQLQHHHHQQHHQQQHHPPYEQYNHNPGQQLHHHQQRQQQPQPHPHQQQQGQHYQNHQSFQNHNNPQQQPQHQQQQQYHHSAHEYEHSLASEYAPSASGSSEFPNFSNNISSNNLTVMNSNDHGRLLTQPPPPSDSSTIAPSPTPMHMLTPTPTPSQALQLPSHLHPNQPQSQSQSRYNPHSQRGRKKTDCEAPSHKAALNREAQRALRERKAAYVKSLEDKIAELQAANAALASNSSNGNGHSCSHGQVAVPTPAASDSTPPFNQQHQQQQQMSSLGFSQSLELESLRSRNQELELKLLTASSSVNSGVSAQTHCINCNSERMKTAICIDQIKVLENQVRSLQNQIASLKSTYPPKPSPALILSHNHSQLPASIPPPPSFVFDLNSMLANQEVLLDFMDTAIDWNFPALALGDSSPVSPVNVPKPSEELFGPMEVDTFKITLKHCTSLRRCPELVDQLFDMLQAETRVTNVRDARKVLVKINRACFRLLENIDRAEKSRYNELFAIFHERNAKHEIYFSELWAPPEHVKRQFASRPLRSLPPHVARFQAILKSIPSYQSSVEAITVVNQFCNIWVYEEDIDGEGFYYYNYCLYYLERLCKNVEDRSKFWEAYDGVWASDHTNVGVLLDTAGSGV